MRYPIGIQTFRDIREGGFVYVDKTAQVYALAQGSKYYFLSRPRRFGKSLLLSTMEAYFSGRKELFEGLAIERQEKDWVQYPVLRFDLGGASYDSEQVLQSKFNEFFQRYEQLYGVQGGDPVASVRFSSLISAAYARTGRQVVILVDEYDKPIVDNLGNEELMETFRSQLQGFYSVMKSQDEFIRFGFLTGVTKLGRLSIFSGLNNLVDISLDAAYADVCGISEKELREYFAGSVIALAQANGLTEQECYAELARMYDGYHFHQKSAGVYNPFSLLNTFSSKEFREYWYFTGTPTFLIRYLQKGGYDLSEVSSMKVSPYELTGTNAARPTAITLLYQAGYLTIKDYDRSTDRYTLTYPNKEVENGFMEALGLCYTPALHNKSSLSVYKFVEDIQSGNAQMLMRRLTAFFADMDYQLMGETELYFQNTLYVMLKLIGQLVQVERHSSNGRMDALIQTDKYVYILELKRDKDPQDALDQIDEKGYDWPFLADERKVFRIGASFSSQTKRLENWKLG